MPTHDWQFWVVTGLAALAGLYLLRAVLPQRVLAKLPSFLAGKRGKAGRQTRATLTVGGRAMGPKAKA